VITARRELSSPRNTTCQAHRKTAGPLGRSGSAARIFEPGAGSVARGGRIVNRRGLPAHAVHDPAVFALFAVPQPGQEALLLGRAAVMAGAAPGVGRAAGGVMAAGRSGSAAVRGGRAV